MLLKIALCPYTSHCSVSRQGLQGPPYHLFLHLTLLALRLGLDVDVIVLVSPGPYSFTGPENQSGCAWGAPINK
jgi:hypothetical protein